MMKIVDFLALSQEQERETLLSAYGSIEDSYDRYRALISVKALARGEAGDDE